MGTMEHEVGRLRTERSVLRALLADTQAQLAYLDPHFNFVEVNAAYAKGSGYTREQLVGRNHFELFPDPENQAIFERVASTGEAAAFRAKPFTFPQRPELGVTYWDWTLTPDKDEQGQVRGLVLSLVDVTERRRVAEATGRFAQRLGTLHHADQAILAGHSAEEVAEATLPYIRELVPCERIGISLFEMGAGRVRLLAVFVNGKTTMPKGWTGPLDDTAWPAELAQGKVRAVEDLASLASLSPFEAKLLAEEVRSWTNVPLIVEGELIGALNLGTKVPGLLTPEQMEVMQEMADQLALGLQQARLRDEIERHAQDLERRVAARTAELQASQARLQTIFDHAPTGVALLGRQGQVVESNTALETLLGYLAEELRDMVLVQLIHPDDADADLANPVHWTEDDAGGYRRSLRMLRKDGELLRVNLTVSALGPEIEGGDRAIAIIEDVTEAAQAQEKLMQSEKLAIAGRLAASLAHEINNPLQSVIGCLSLVEEAQAEGGNVDRYMQVARQELKRAVGIIGRLRDVYSPAKPGDKKPTDLNSLIEGVLTLTQKRCEDSDVEVLWRPARDLPSLNLVPGSMQQVFLNLVLNAVEAMPQGGRLEVSTARTKRPAGVRVTVADDGGGIPAEALPRLFQPFQTSKADGLGLGLFVTQRIVEEHGGRISVESRAGVGSTFHVWLPR